MEDGVNGQQSAFRYNTTGRWFKGNTHIHSTVSDGGKTFRELADMYAAAGYDFLFRADHWAASDVEQDGGKYPLLWLDGIELDGPDSTGAQYHVVCLGTVRNIVPEMGLVAAMESARKQGAMIVLAHPFWTGNSLDDALRHGFDAVEIYNHVCRWLNSKSDSLVHWDAMLSKNPNVLGLSVDDAHIQPSHPGWNGGWIGVNATACSRDAILNAIRRGNYYSSCGPAFNTIELSGDTVSITTSPVQFVRLVGPTCNGERAGTFDGPAITTATFQLHPEWQHAYIEIEDAAGRRAWTNNLFANQRG